MSGCGKKGGIPKKFHKEEGGAWNEGVGPGKRGAYSKWITGKWKALSKEERKKYFVGKGLNKNKCAPIPKLKSNGRFIIGKKFVMDYAFDAEDTLKIWRAWRKELGGSPTQEQYRRFMNTNAGLFTTDGRAVYKLRIAGMNHVWMDPNKKGPKTIEEAYKSRTGRAWKAPPFMQRKKGIVKQEDSDKPLPIPQKKKPTPPPKPATFGTGFATLAERIAAAGSALTQTVKNEIGIVDYPYPYPTTSTPSSGPVQALVQTIQQAVPTGVSNLIPSSWKGSNTFQKGYKKGNVKTESPSSNPVQALVQTVQEAMPTNILQGGSEKKKGPSGEGGIPSIQEWFSYVEKKYPKSATVDYIDNERVRIVNLIVPPQFRPVRDINGKKVLTRPEDLLDVYEDGGEITTIPRYYQFIKGGVIYDKMDDEFEDTGVNPKLLFANTPIEIAGPTMYHPQMKNTFKFPLLQHIPNWGEWEAYLKTLNIPKEERNFSIKIPNEFIKMTDSHNNMMEIGQWKLRVQGLGLINRYFSYTKEGDYIYDRMDPFGGFIHRENIPDNVEFDVASKSSYNPY